MFGRNENKHSHSHLINLGMRNKIFLWNLGTQRKIIICEIDQM